MKTINIKGKNYVQVNERIKEFHKLYPNGKIYTRIISNEDGVVTMKATVWPDIDKKDRNFTGHASEWQKDPKSMVNITSYVENCETSAIGRAMASLGIGIDESFASSNEVQSAVNRQVNSEDLKCQKCGGFITYAEKMYSMKQYNVEYCRECQKKIKETDSPF